MISKRSNPTEIPRLERGCSRRFARAVCRSRWPRHDRTQFGRYQRHLGRDRARLPFDGRIVGARRRQVLRAPRRSRWLRRRSRTIRSVEEHTRDSKMTVPLPPFSHHFSHHIINYCASGPHIACAFFKIFIRRFHFYPPCSSIKVDRCLHNSTYLVVNSAFPVTMTSFSLSLHFRPM